MTNKKHRALDWRNTLFIGGVHLGALVLAPIYLTVHGLSLEIALLTFALFMIGGLSITIGYHRLYAHRSFKAHKIVKFVTLLVGAGQFQSTALKWVSDHRRHHAKADTKDDPYSIMDGFWHAHCGWLFWKDPEEEAKMYADGNVDLIRDPIVMWQKRYYVPLAIFIGFVVPTALGFLLGDIWGGFVMAGVFRLAIMYQATFCINSLAHYVGKKPYDERGSACDSWISALVTWGEGWHNFHHRFASDYRLGIHWWQYDPGKWIIKILSWCKLTYDLRRTPAEKIERALKRSN